MPNDNHMQSVRSYVRENNNLRLFSSDLNGTTRECTKKVRLKESAFDARYRWCEKVRKDSEHTAGWVSGRGNKRGSKSRPGPGVANERAPASSPRGGFEQAMTSLGASRRRPFHPRSMTRPCLPRPAFRRRSVAAAAARHPPGWTNWSQYSKGRRLFLQPGNPVYI